MLFKCASKSDNLTTRWSTDPKLYDLNLYYEILILTRVNLSKYNTSSDCGKSVTRLIFDNNNNAINKTIGSIELFEDTRYIYYDFVHFTNLEFITNDTIITIVVNILGSLNNRINDSVYKKVNEYNSGYTTTCVLKYRAAKINANTDNDLGVDENILKNIDDINIHISSNGKLVVGTIVVDDYLLCNQYILLYLLSNYSSIYNLLLTETEINNLLVRDGACDKNFYNTRLLFVLTQ